MELRYAFLCDYANVTNDGKLNAFGVVDRIFAPAFPAMHRSILLIVSLCSDHDDQGRSCSVDIQLIDPDAQIVSRIQGQIEFAQGKQILNQIHCFQDVVFQAPGAYQFNIYFDEQLVRAVDLELVLVHPQPQG